MADGWFRTLRGDGSKLGVASAGIVGGTGVKEGAAVVMKEAGIDISGYSSDAMADFAATDFVAVISCCGCGSKLDGDKVQRGCCRRSRAPGRATKVFSRRTDGLFQSRVISPFTTQDPPAPLSPPHCRSGPYGAARCRRARPRCRRRDGGARRREQAVWKAQAIFEDWNLDDPPATDPGDLSECVRLAIASAARDRRRHRRWDGGASCRAL